MSEVERESFHQDQWCKVEVLLLKGLDSGEATPMTKADWAAIRQAVREDLEDWEDLQAAKAEDVGESSLSLEEVKRELGLG